MALQEKLDAFRLRLMKQIPPDMLRKMKRATEELVATGLAERALPIGSELPSFALPNQDGNEIRLGDLLRRGPLVVSFFRGGWCPYCNFELEALGDATDRIRELGAEIVVITPQLEHRSAQIREEKTLKFDMLTDKGLDYADELGIAFTLPPEVVEIYRGFDLDIPGYNGDESWRLPMPTRLVLDRSGVIVQRNVEPDYTRRPDPAQTVDFLRHLAQELR